MSKQQPSKKFPKVGVRYYDSMTGKTAPPPASDRPTRDSRMKCFGCKIFVGWYKTPIVFIVSAESEKAVKPLVLKALIEYLGSGPINSMELPLDKREAYAKEMCEWDDTEIFEIEMKPNTALVLGADDFDSYWW